jgi:hypothetical protein|tara:strand:- start:514 stop:1182 length:669 start_codon:yes stop_codon:yes gene_type:complete
MLASAIIGGAASIAGGIIGASAAKDRERAARKERLKLQGKLEDLENNRQDIINPYAGVSDLSSMISNPFANLSVATGAAEMQIEEADVSLANTLDTMRATGAGAGGATALAQAALRSKKGVSASIEAQEKTNQDKMAAGEQALQQQKMAEAQRIQQSDVAGEQFMFSTREGRELEQLDRTAAMLGAAKQAEAQAQSDRTGAITGAVGSLTQMAGGYMAASSS